MDVGGTFTDVVKLVPETGELLFDKVATTPQAPAHGVLDAFKKSKTEIQTVGLFAHGTTLGLNALLTRNGARVAVIGTRGFRDVYLLGRTDRIPQYDITYTKPEALVERFDTFEVSERCLADGTVHSPFDDDDARRIAQIVAGRGYQSIAVAFLHSYANPAHELRMREILHEYAPGAEVTLSHELSREYHEYERTSTAVLDAYIKPIMRNYLQQLEDALAAEDFAGRFLVTRSGGGGMTVARAKEQPVNLILSGPAGGVVGAAGFSRLIDRPNLITIDMGGTSLDASIIFDSEPVLYHEAEFEGLPINTPSLYIHTVGAGGGSLAWLDEAGALQVGPQSAGATPGPACYGRGGTLPTFTDAAVLIGYLDDETPLAGTLVLDRSRARASLEPIAAALGLSVEQLATGIVTISITKIMAAVRAITVELGHDPRDFALLAFGGAGGLVAVNVARELGIPSVIIPPGQGAFSALGMLMADVQHDFARTRIVSLDDTVLEIAGRYYAEMEAEAKKQLISEGFDADKQHLVRTVDLRYSGQEHSVTIEFADDDGNGVEGLSAAFAERHKRQYGHTMNDPIEVSTFRLRATGIVDKPRLPLLEERHVGSATPVAVRSVHLPDSKSVKPYPLYIRESLLAGDTITGPAIIAEHTATTIIHQGDTLRVGSHSELVVAVGPDVAEVK